MTREPGRVPDPHDAPEKDGGAAIRRTYEKPQIAWREPYEPVSFGASCAKQPGNPPCNPFVKS